MIGAPRKSLSLSKRKRIESEEGVPPPVPTQVSGDVITSDPVGPTAPGVAPTQAHGEVTNICVVCGCNFAGMTLLEAEVHRNNCLDVDPHEPPDAGDWLTQKVYEHETIAIDDEWDEGGSEGDSDVEFCEARSPPVAVAPPPQKSAFAVLMQGARDTAAAVAKTALAAASAIVSVGGPPASRRPCPFYKRIPGTPIVVDGFQYASKQLSAHYVLTHFHR